MNYRWGKPTAFLDAPRPQHALPSLLTISRTATAGVAVLSLAAAALVGLVATHGAASAADTRVRPSVARAAVAGVVAAGLTASSSGARSTASGVVPGFAGTTAPRAATGPSSTAGPAQPPDTTPASELAASGLPATALAAYENAAARERTINPGCRLTWPLLAGIGRIESNHGRFAGAVLHSDGLSTPQVVGIPLDGHGTALIRDTDRGRFDGDRVYDRAVGPMQFIPSTWASWGVDADHDGVANPFDIVDAAAAAADYLCAAGRDLSTYAGQVQAVLSYNHSAAYVASVLGVERIYAGQGGVRVPVIPTGPDLGIGQTTAPRLPPVDPGPPRGLPPRKPKPTSGSSTKASSSRPASSSSAPSTPANPASSSPSSTPTTTPPSTPECPSTTTDPSSSPSSLPTGASTDPTCSPPSTVPDSSSNSASGDAAHAATEDTAKAAAAAGSDPS